MTVPDVEHQELRSAYSKLTGRGFEVRFAVGDLYRRYATDSTVGIDPEPWVGDIDPEPGTELPDQAVVTITEIECPERAASCE